MPKDLRPLRVQAPEDADSGLREDQDLSLVPDLDGGAGSPRERLPEDVQGFVQDPGRQVLLPAPARPLVVPPSREWTPLFVSAPKTDPPAEGPPRWTFRGGPGPEPESSDTQEDGLRRGRSEVHRDPYRGGPVVDRPPGCGYSLPRPTLGTTRSPLPRRRAGRSL